MHSPPRRLASETALALTAIEDWFRSGPGLWSYMMACSQHYPLVGQNQLHGHQQLVSNAEVIILLRQASNETVIGEIMPHSRYPVRRDGGGLTMPHPPRPATPKAVIR